MLAAACGRDLESTLVAIVCRLAEVPAELSPADCTVKHRSLGFRLLSRAACGLHRLLRMPHRGYPYKLFKLLLGDGEAGHPAECLQDELAHAFLKHYPPDTCGFQPGSPEMVVLETLADVLKTDIAQIEAKHATIRRLTQRMSLQTWVADWQQLVSAWLVRQLPVNRMWPAKPSPATAEADKPQPGARNGQRGEKARGGGGGAMRAFYHVNYQGVAATAQTFKDAAEAYGKLSDQQKEFYRELGAKATEACRAGFPGFGPRNRRRTGELLRLNSGL